MVNRLAQPPHLGSGSLQTLATLSQFGSISAQPLDLGAQPRCFNEQPPNFIMQFCSQRGQPLNLVGGLLACQTWNAIRQMLQPFYDVSQRRTSPRLPARPPSVSFPRAAARSRCPAALF